MLIAQITDPHVSTPGAQLYGGYLPDFALSDVVARVRSLDPRPDFVWLTGDLTENGTAEEYANFRGLIAQLDLPMAAIPGNHDSRDEFGSSLSGTGIQIGDGPFLSLIVDGHAVRMIGLDSKGAAGDSAGMLSDGQLAWLGERLDEDRSTPTAIFLHHPPFETGIGFVDATRCAAGPALGALVSAHGNVRLVSSGHVHRPVQTQWAGTIASICPSIAWALPLALAPGAPGGIVPQSPGFQLHLWTGQAFVTHTDYLPGD